MKIKIISLCIAAVLTACGGSSDSGGGSPEPESKNLFSVWTNTQDDEDVLDLEEASFGEEMDFQVIYPDGATCNCTLELTGNQSGGNFILNSCEYESFTSEYGDPGCNDLNGTGTYEIDGDTLTVCDDELECDTYE